MAKIHVSLGLFYMVQERLTAEIGGGARLRFLVSISPVVAVFLAAEAMAPYGEAGTLEIRIGSMAGIDRDRDSHGSAGGVL